MGITEQVEWARSLLQSHKLDLVEAKRAHRFLWAQSQLVMAIGILGFALGPSLGLVAPHQRFATGIMTVVVLLMTLLGWRIFVRTENYSRLVLGILYADAVVGVVGYYALGEIEGPHVSCTVLLVFMAPLFGPKRHAWGLATVMTVIYCSLLGLRQAGVLGYVAMLPPPTSALGSRTCRLRFGSSPSSFRRSSDGTYSSSNWRIRPTSAIRSSAL